MTKCLFCEKSVPPGAASCPYCRAPLGRRAASVRSGVQDQVQTLLDQGEKIEAIKVYREETGASLAEARAAVEALQSGDALPAADRPLDAAWEREIVDLLRAGKKIEAVRRYRTQTGTGLKQAREAVEAIARREGIAPRGGCRGLTLGLIAVTGAAIVAAAVVWLTRA